VLVNGETILKSKLSLAAVLLLVGCATTPVPADKAKPVPPDRIFIQPQAQSDSGQIVIVRDGGLFGSACNVGFYLDGTLAAELASAEVATFAVPPGEHIMGLAAAGVGLCSPGFMGRKETSSIVKPGEVKYYRLVVRQDSGMTIEPSTMLGK
jgi:hypothetical protein